MSWPQFPSWGTPGWSPFPEPVYPSQPGPPQWVPQRGLMDPSAWVYHVTVRETDNTRRNALSARLYALQTRRRR